MMPAAPCPVQPWNGTLVRSRLFDAISLLLPAAEAFMIETLAQWREQAGAAIDDEQRGELDRFIREERAHQRAHRRYNEALIAERPAAEAAARRAALATDGLSRLGLPTRIALAAAFEQLTAVLSHEVIGRRSLMVDSGATQVRMWRWHAREELAHCHIALRAARCAGIGRGRKALALCAATGFLLFDIASAWWALCRCDIAVGAGRGRVAAEAVRFAWEAVPALARMSLGWLRCVLT